VDVRRRILKNQGNIYRKKSTLYSLGQFQLNAAGTHQLMNWNGEITLATFSDTTTQVLATIQNTWDLVVSDIDTAMKRMVAIDRRGTVKICDITVPLVVTWEANKNEAYECIAADLSLDGQWLLLGYKDQAKGHLELWNISTSTPELFWSDDVRDLITCVNFVGGHNLTFVIGTEGFIPNLIEIAPFKRVALLRNYSLLGHTGKILSVKSSSDGQWVVTASEDGTAIIWDAEKGNAVTQLTISEGSIKKVLFTPDNRHIFISTDRGVVQCWDLNGVLVQTYRCASAAVEDMSVWMSPDQRALNLVTTSNNFSENAYLHPYFLDHWQPLFPDEHDNTGHTLGITGLAVSPNGQWIVSCSRDQLVKCWEVSTGKVSWTYHCNTRVNSVAWRGATIVLGLGNGEIRQLNSAGMNLRTIRSNVGAINTLDLENNGKSILYASRDKQTLLVNSKGNLINSIEHKVEVTAVAYGHKKAQFASVDNSGMLNIAPEKSNRKRTITKPLSDTTLLDIDWSPADLYLAVTGIHGFAVIVSPEGRILHRLEHPKDVSVTSVAFLSDQWLATGDSYGTLRLFSALTGQRITYESLPNGNLNAIVAANDQNTLFVADELGKIWRFHLKDNHLEFGKIYIGHGGYTDWATVLNPQSNDPVIVTGSGTSRNLRFWDRHKIEQKRLPMAPGDQLIYHFTQIGNGKAFFGSSMERVVRWDSVPDRPAQVIGYHTAPLIAIKGGTQLVASVDQQNQLKVWDEVGLLKDSLAMPGQFNAICWADSGRLIVALDTNRTNAKLFTWSVDDPKHLKPFNFKAKYFIQDIQKHPIQPIFAILEQNEIVTLTDASGKIIKRYNTGYVSDIRFTENQLWTWSGSHLQAWDISDNPRAVYPLFEYNMPNYEQIIAVQTVPNWIMICGLRSGPVYLPNQLEVLNTGNIEPISNENRAKFGLIPAFEEYLYSNNTAELGDGIVLYHKMVEITRDSADQVRLNDQVLQLCQRYNEFDSLPVEYQENLVSTHTNMMELWINGASAEQGEMIQQFSRQVTALVTDTTLQYDIHTELWNNSWALILAGAYQAGATMAQRAIEMNLPEPRRYTTITNQLVGQLLSGQLSLQEAELAYCKWMKVPWSEDERFTYYGDIFQLDIDELRAEGHLSPADAAKLDYMEAFLKEEKCK
jgi:WD40 repeat protein